MENQVTSHIIKGVVLSVISIVFGVVMYVFNLYENTWMSWVSQAIVFGGLVYGCVLYANQNKNNVTFGNVFAHGFKTTAVIIVITAIYTFLSTKFLFPDMVDKIIEISRKEMEKNPKLTDEMIEAGVAMSKKYFLPFALGGIVIGTGFIGLIASLIGAAVAKKNPNPFQETAA